MTDRDRNQRENDSLQSSEIDPALGQDARAYGAGGQKVQRTLDGDDAPDRDVDRDASLPDNADPSARRQEQDA